jgi:cobalt-precorrin 5A hydrolase
MECDAMMVAGIGFRKAAPLSALAEALALAEAAAGCRATALATESAKAGAPVMQALAARLGLPILAVSVAGVATPVQSGHVQTRFGTGSLAEAAALVAAGPEARLLVGRVVSACGMATAAMAVGDRT